MFKVSGEKLNFYYGMASAASRICFSTALILRSTATARLGCEDGASRDHRSKYHQKREHSNAFHRSPQFEPCTNWIKNERSRFIDSPSNDVSSAGAWLTRGSASGPRFLISLASPTAWVQRPSRPFTKGGHRQCLCKGGSITLRRVKQTRKVGQPESFVRGPMNKCYCNFAYSALASVRTGIFASASFQRVRKS